MVRQRNEQCMHESDMNVKREKASPWTQWVCGMAYDVWEDSLDKSMKAYKIFNLLFQRQHYNI